MGKWIEQFGNIVGQNVPVRPKRARLLLKAAYRASGFQMRYWPDARLLPHQKEAAVICNRAIQAPLNKPQDSAVVNVFLPCELLHAMGVAPQFTEGLACYLNGAKSESAFIGYAEQSGVPQTYCSYHKVLLGAALSGMLPVPRFIANTTLACDANTNTFRTLANHWQVPHFTVDVPNYCDREAVAYVASQLRDLACLMEDVMGQKLEDAKLKAVIRSENHSLAMYRTYFRELSGKYLKNGLTDEMYKIFLTHVLMGTAETERYFTLLLDDVQKAAPRGKEIRVLWVHSIPFWQPSMKDFFNFNDKYQLLCCDLNFDFISEMDEAQPYEAMADKLLQNTLCGSEQKRGERILEMAELLHADGVVYFCHWGCKQTLGGAFLTKETLEKAGVPILLLDGDGCDRGNVNDGQMVTRLQAFLEILEAAK